MKKRSNIILALIALSLFVGLGLYANHIKNNIEAQGSRWSRDVKIVEGDDFVKEFDLTYKHLHVEYPGVSIDGRYQDHVELSGVSVASDMVSYDVCQDTLYIRHSEDLPKYVGRNAEAAVAVHVGGVGLKSITVGSQGSIALPIRAKGTRRDGKTVYKDEDAERYTLKFDTLDIINGPVNMLLEGQALNIHMESNINTLFNLQGQVDRLDLEYHKGGNIIVNGYGMDSRIASINADKNKDGVATGSIQLTVMDTLIANLYGAMDVDYRGTPEVIKYVRSTGRVVHQYIPEPEY